MKQNVLLTQIIIIATGLFVALTSYILVKMGIIIASIAWLICAAFLLSTACIYLYRRRKYFKHIENNSSFEIDRILKVLQNFWGKYQKISEDKNKHMEIVISKKPFTTTSIQFKYIFPKLHQGALKSIRLRKAKDFHRKIEDIELIYKELRSKPKQDFEQRFQWEALILEVLERGNPLKKNSFSLRG